jgi:hypothetical protein
VVLGHRRAISFAAAGELVIRTATNRLLRLRGRSVPGSAPRRRRDRVVNRPQLKTLRLRVIAVADPSWRVATGLWVGKSMARRWVKPSRFAMVPQTMNWRSMLSASWPSLERVGGTAHFGCVWYYRR